ncbi:hypothetical protein [Allorhizobium taibaishanense]|uniref:Uncharacterized protein n=1 Tax=Allorhizobium taibaishanense TaxID=887144 RepID=A0A1Q9A9E5_9HYPH|nr:hypothetical protein [Allorhizobium taibaishanense]MBB4009868.1 hypothetical protein [Allorhizobium taibaishanense]OLP51500.1 hypothetical protein BJF91_15760 [Allorhizobium taibaishanense]
MIADLFASLIAFFLVDPVEAELRARFASLNAPPAIIAQMQACMVDAGAQIVQRAVDQPVWAVRSSVAVGLGLTDPADIVIGISPACQAPLAWLSARNGGENV